MKDGEKSFSKLFEILETIADSKCGLSAKEISGHSGLPLSTTFRMLKFLADHGYLRSGKGIYSLGAGLARFGNLARSQNPLLKVVRPYLEELSEKTLETVHLAELKDDKVIYIDKVDGARSIRMGSMIGKYSPVYCTGIGKALLAFQDDAKRDAVCRMIRFEKFTPKTISSRSALERELKKIRSCGYALDDCEHESGVYCVAAPVLDYAGHAVAGISISGSELYLREKTKHLATLLMDTVEKISAELGN